jgi:hypothetical protein
VAETRRLIGLSLGADICWPICFEQILRELDPAVTIGGETIRFDVERVSIEPFYLRQQVRYDVVIDRLTHWYGTSREWIKKAVVMDDLYVFNNPWSIQSNEKHTSYCAMMRLGMPIPTTWMVPPKSYEPAADLQITLERYAEMFDLAELGAEVGYPHYIKPYDGGGWKGVSRIDDADALQAVYDDSGTYLMHLQQAVEPHDLFIRCVGLGPQVRVVRYDPGAPLHDRYTADDGEISDDQRRHLIDTTLTINSFFGWDFNSCEALRQDDRWYPIDFANPCPDSQVTSLHYHFPWLIGANLRWGLFCAATGRKVRPNLDWQPYFDIADTDAPYEEKLAGYAAIARRRLAVAEFEEFDGEHLGDLDRVLWDFFGSDTAHDAVRQKVVAMYPEHEVDEFTEMFWQRIQHWRHDNDPTNGRADQT